MDILERLNSIKKIITSKEFKENLGSANEVSFYVFDYEPVHEMLVRHRVKHLVEQMNDAVLNDMHIDHFDLYDIMIDYLKEEDLLDDVFSLEEEEGYDEVSASIRDAMGIDSMDNNYFIDYIQDHIDEQSIVFITGVGKVYPIIRAHKILNNLHLAIDHIPVVLFLPGRYENMEIKLFGLMSNNYYRAFKLV